ncbi:serine hydrolase (FSH1) domain-containing protein [Hirsutella rhossiliensis]|uniref:Serine hydrolase (FSH1) domain-containing protein n=1 Tax=Hirsutella rhossiliensis TaxID=111463 RepID=A0A9P8SDZ2_9HYPO|nr:serine hydrolase (FSH1) domain-containing protein [Hirsutella rhossiliensis]KAH0959268.1 serine hydrolase (FSH1) domain-containing protein [Hirsutella rhossiliensis]
MALGSEGSDSSLHFPRILCLHGGGTNARIFRMQCRAFKYHLGSEFRFVFAAPFPARPGPDVTAVYSNCGPFRGWLRPVDETEDQDFYAAEASMLIQNSINTATIADNHLGATGEVVGVLGFARIAASLLYNQQLRCQQLDGGSEMKTNSVMNWPNFRFAVLLAGRGRLVWLMPDVPMPQDLFLHCSPLPYRPCCKTTLLAGKGYISMTSCSCLRSMSTASKM